VRLQKEEEIQLRKWSHRSLHWIDGGRKKGRIDTASKRKRGGECLEPGLEVSKVGARYFQFVTKTAYPTFVQDLTKGRLPGPTEWSRQRLGRAASRILSKLIAQGKEGQRPGADKAGGIRVQN